MWYNQNLCIMIVLSIFLIAVAFITVAVLLTSLKAKGLIEGGNPSGEDFRTTKREDSPSKPCEFYDDSNEGPVINPSWMKDLRRDMYGVPLNRKRYERAKRREAKYYGLW